MVDRIKHIMEFYKLTPASLAEQIGINRSNLTHLFSGRNQPSLELAKKILHCYPDIKTEWLIMGVGEMFRNNEDKELQLQIQNERRVQTGVPKPNLFSTIPTVDTINTVVESRVVEQKKLAEQIFDSREVDKKVVSTPIKSEKELLLPHSSEQISKIVFFYSDNSFEVFQPNKSVFFSK